MILLAVPPSSLLCVLPQYDISGLNSAGKQLLNFWTHGRMRSGRSGTNGWREQRKRERRQQWLSTAQRLSSERRERHMEAVLKNLASTVELLAVAAHSDVVEQWDKQTLSRAFHWARYCEHLFSRFHNNSAVRRVIEKQLLLTNQSLRAALPGYTEVSFLDLSRSQHHLLVGLLNNPKLPSSIMTTLFDSKSPADTKHIAYQDVTGLCSHIIQCKSACKVLSPLTGSSAVGADAEVQGVMLMERLDVLLSQSSEACRTEHFLDSVLQGCEGAAEHFCLVIAAALLTMKNSVAETASQDFLMDWLQKKHNMLRHMCSALPITLLIDLAKKHLKFRDAYCDVLKKWASDMEYSISEGEWVQTTTNPTVSFLKLTEHFQALFETCPSLRDDVKKELNALKISDGDFDVRGLSVWGDLLLALNL
ncbi:Fanconi anemia group F protein [Trachinotus anak]|uniref:Fanconi anemia group F protein n=1 Tax=Trachinotus anak TaxID=443729 RepID=UPI0039F20ACA